MLLDETILYWLCGRLDPIGVKFQRKIQHNKGAKRKAQPYGKRVSQDDVNERG